MIPRTSAYGRLQGLQPPARPLAGIMALVVLQKLGGQPQGAANYVFYRLTNTPGVYHDIIHDTPISVPRNCFLRRLWQLQHRSKGHLRGQCDR